MQDRVAAGPDTAGPAADALASGASSSREAPSGREGTPEAGNYGLDVMPPLSAVAELAVMFGLLLVADYLWPALDIHNLQPSPYWIPVLLLTLQYGTASGTMAVAAAIALYFSLVTLPEQGVGENEFSYRLRILAQPILWIGAAVVLGQFRMVQIAAKRELRRLVDELRAQRDTLADYAGRLRRRCDALERDIAARPLDAGPRLLAAIGRLDDRSEPAADAVAQLFGAAYPDAGLSLFALRGGALIRVASAGWPARAPFLDRLPAGHRLVSAIAARARPAIVTPDGEAALSGQGIAAVAVLDPLNGAVIGMIKMETAHARFVGPELTAGLDALAAVVAPALPRIALQGQDA